MIRQKRQRSKIGKASEFRIRGKFLDEARIANYLKRSYTSEDEILSRGVSPAKSDFSAITCYTPIASPSPIAIESDQLVQDEEALFHQKDVNELSTQFHQTNECPKTLLQKLNIAESGSSTAVPDEHAILTVTSVPRFTIPASVSPPVLYMVSGRIFGHIMHYIKASSESRSGPSSGKSRRTARPSSWPNLLRDASCLLSQGNVAEATKTLGRAFARLERRVKGKGPGFILDLLWIINTSGTSKEATIIARILLKQLYHRTCLLLGVDHPFGVISRDFLLLESWDNVSEIAHRIVCDSFESAIDAANAKTINGRLDLIIDHIRHKDFTAAESQLLNFLQDHRVILRSPLYELTNTLLFRGKFAEPKEMTQGIIRSIDGPCIGGQSWHLRLRFYSFWAMSIAQLG